MVNQASLSTGIFTKNELFSETVRKLTNMTAGQLLGILLPMKASLDKHSACLTHTFSHLKFLSMNATAVDENILSV